MYIFQEIPNKIGFWKNKKNLYFFLVIYISVFQNVKNNIVQDLVVPNLT